MRNILSGILLGFDWIALAYMISIMAMYFL